MPRYLAAFPLAVALLAAAPAFAAELEVSAAWARPVPSATGTGGVYLVIANRGPAEERLLGIETPVAARAELHETTVEGGVASMRPVGELAVPAGGRVELAPGGLHLMLLGLKSPLARDAHFPLTLRFASGKQVTTEVIVTMRAPAAEQGHGSHTRHGPP